MKRSRRRLQRRGWALRGAFLAVVVALGLGVFPAPVGAATFEYTRAVLGSPGSCDAAFAEPGITTYFGSGCFVTTGDYIRVQDKLADSYIVGVQWRVGLNLRQGICVNAYGNGTSAYCNYDFPETYWVDLRVGRCYSWRDCNLLSNWVNWGDWQGTGNMR